MKKKRILFYFVPPWCNGNTTGFELVILGSIPSGVPVYGAIVYRLGHQVFILASGVRFPVALPESRYYFR